MFKKVKDLIMIEEIVNEDIQKALYIMACIPIRPDI